MLACSKFANTLFGGVSNAAKSTFSPVFLSLAVVWGLSYILLHQKQSQNPCQARDFPFLFELLCALVRTRPIAEVPILANYLPCKCFCPQWDSDPACKQNSFYINTWEISSQPHRACMSVDIYLVWGLELNQIGKQHLIILVKFCCFWLPSPVALPWGAEKIKAFAHGHTLTWVSGSPYLNSDDLSLLLS